ncbi:MAG: metallophosphoesterase [Candidatus Ratteibacteria bacterium]|jgi:3',5'-cyclic AMP phosphodiesterase CpdA
MKKEWKFLYVTDMQPGSPKSFRFKPAWVENWKTAREQIMNLKFDFMLIGGDVTRDGSIHRWELEEMKKDFDSMGVTYHVVPGNMDTGNKHADRQGARDDRDDRGLNITSEQLRVWKSIYGDWKWSFVHNNLRVTGICDMIINSGLPEEKELWDWIEEEKKAPRAEHHIWIMHSPPFINSPDEPNWDYTRTEEYIKWYFSIDLPGRARLMEVFKETGVERVITGHVHCMHDSFFKGILFESAPAISAVQFTEIWPEGIEKQGFYLYTVSGENIMREFIPLSVISTRTDSYGPGGHPKPETRDYSLAWEKNK